MDKECWTHEPEFDKYVVHRNNRNRGFFRSPGIALPCESNTSFFISVVHRTDVSLLSIGYYTSLPLPLPLSLPPPPLPPSPSPSPFPPPLAFYVLIIIDQPFRYLCKKSPCFSVKLAFTEVKKYFCLCVVGYRI